MKKSILFVAGLVVAFAFTGCKSKESAYRLAYEKAQAADAAATAQNQQSAAIGQPVVTPLVDRPVNDTRVVDNSDNVSVRQERLTLVSGKGLDAFSVVVGSFSVKANAEGLQNTLINAGYNAQIAYNADRNMYRVVASTFSNKYDAVQSREQLKSRYPDAWLLYNQ